MRSLNAPIDVEIKVANATRRKETGTGLTHSHRDKYTRIDPIRSQENRYFTLLIWPFRSSEHPRRSAVKSASGRGVRAAALVTAARPADQRLKDLQ